ncbi:nuclear transport factor 2 family protein [Pseudonocardia lutea]|uniref:Nuclear transport factor 2 family protein n=1 Tax=Pseudonocardia lutea TaxID=2172015 RepID=A0ABW1ICQ4_9PSEU
MSHSAVGPDDHRRIERLVHLYAYHLDAGDFRALGSLFARADLYVGEDLVAAKDPAAVSALWERFVRRYPEGTPQTHHVSTNLLVEAEGPDRARAHSYILVFQAAPGFPLQPLTAGDYLDRFARDPHGEWHFTERRIGNHLFGDMSHHLLEPMPEPRTARPQRWERTPG